MQYYLRYCLECEADQETAGPKSCTNCGSERVTAGTYDPGPITLGGEGGAYREYGTARLWQEQWYRAMQRFKALEAVYQPGTYRNDDIATAGVEDFFEHCHRVGDWLWRDKGITLKKDEVQDFIKNDRALKVCKGISNSMKHHDRDWKGSMNAVVRRVYRQEDRSASAVIEWWYVGQEDKPRAVDALELAEGCMAAWKQYLKDNKLRLWHAKTRKNYL